MAKIDISAEFLADILFAWTNNPVEIVDARYSDLRRKLELDIKGADVPDVERVRSTFTVRSNRAGERFHTIVFEPA